MGNANDFHFAAVLTGDIIKSRRQSNTVLDAMMTTLRDATHDIGRDMGVDAVFSRHRGDGWQVFLPKGRCALRATLRLIAALTAHHKGAETRIGIGLGNAVLPDDLTLGAASGGAFTRSGDALAGLSRHHRLSLSLPPNAPLTALTALLDWQARQWTAAQSEALFEALRQVPQTQEDIATTIGGVTRQAVQIRLSGVGLYAVVQAIDAFEHNIQETWARDTPSESPPDGAL
jgi:hypothetical protein